MEIDGSSFDLIERCWKLMKVLPSVNKNAWKLTEGLPAARKGDRRSSSCMES